MSLKQHLTRALTGRVADPGDAEYHNALEIDNGRVSLEPSLVVIPGADVSGIGQAAEQARIEALIGDVRETVRICSEEGVRLTVRAGGHGASGYSLNDGGVVLDIKNLDWAQLDRDTDVVRVGVGQRFRRLYDHIEMSRTGLVPVGGGCPTVGVAGFLLGGGYSFLSRSYGMGIDNVRRMRVVTADGTLREVTADSGDPLDRDLFWGLRGAGGGNFGVLVEADMHCQKPEFPALLVANVLFPFHRLPDILPFYNDWVQTLPDEMAVYGYLGSQGDPRMPGDQPLMLRLTAIYNGAFSDGIELLQPLLGRAPVSTQIYNMTLPEWEDLIASGTEVKGRSAYIRSAVLDPGRMDGRIADVFMYYMNRRPSDDSFVVWTHTGGKIAQVAPDATAYPHRNSLFVPEIKSIWRSDRPDLMRANVEWALDFFNAVAEHGTGAYLNYIDPLQKDWKRAYHGDNYARLERLRSAVDPDGFFMFQQGIGSSFEPDTEKPLNLAPLMRTWS
jgi:hypothetical protein